MSLSWVQIFILTIIPLGQLYARIFYLKGSLDSKWALFPLFMIPPLQFIPIMMMKFKLIKKGKGGQPYDYFMLIPIILKFAVGFILSGIESPSYQILDVIIETISIMVPFLIRATSNCGQLTFESLFNTLSNTTTLQVVIILFNIAIKFIPVVGIFFRITGKIPVVGKILPWIICYSAGYIILNMINDNDLKKYCGSYPKVMNTVLSIVILVGAKYFTSSLNV